jgi:hypothetical protein
VLLKSPKGPEVSPADVFSYNAAFSNPLFRIKVNNIQLKETQEENAKTNAEVRTEWSVQGCVPAYHTAQKQYCTCCDWQQAVCRCSLELNNLAIAAAM